MYFHTAQSVWASKHWTQITYKTFEQAEKYILKPILML